MSEAKKDTISVRLTSKTIKRIEEYADAEGLSQSDAIRELLERGHDAYRTGEILEQLEEQNDLLEDLIRALDEQEPGFGEKVRKRWF